jgi:hypothetical protein
VRPKTEGVPNKGAHDGTGSTVLNGGVGHVLILLVVKLFLNKAPIAPLDRKNSTSIFCPQSSLSL